MSLQVIRYVLKAALRDKMVWGLLAIFVLGACLSFFSGSAAAIEQDQFVVAYMAGGLRILALIGLSLFVVFFVRRSYDSRDIEFLLTRPVSRGGFVLSLATGFSLIALFCGIFLSGILGLLSVHYNEHDGIALWGLGVTFEFILVCNVAFFFSMVLTSPVTAGLGTLGFYVLSRLMGGFLSIALHPAMSTTDGMKLVVGVTKVVSVIIPRFDLMAQTSWLIYGGPRLQDWLFVVVQAGVFLTLVLSATIIDLRRKQF